jgi:hypothetical protein
LLSIISDFPFYETETAASLHNLAALGRFGLVMR